MLVSQSLIGCINIAVDEQVRLCWTCVNNPFKRKTITTGWAQPIISPALMLQGRSLQSGANAPSLHTITHNNTTRLLTQMAHELCLVTTDQSKPRHA